MGSMTMIMMWSTLYSPTGSSRFGEILLLLPLRHLGDTGDDVVDEEQVQSDEEDAGDRERALDRGLKCCSSQGEYRCSCGGWLIEIGQ